MIDVMDSLNSCWFGKGGSRDQGEEEIGIGFLMEVVIYVIDAGRGAG